MRKILITGGAGFIGSNFVRHWADHYPDDLIIVLDKLSYAGNLANLNDVMPSPRFHFIQGDIVDKALIDDILTRFQIDTIVNFAAESHVDRSIQNSDLFMLTNIMGTHNLLTVAKSHWQGRSHRFHQVSTDEVFGALDLNEPPFCEDNRYLPNSPYAASKAAADHVVRAFQQTYGMNTTISHCSNNYGPYHYPEKLIPLSLINILHGRWIPIYGDGLQIRDWLHVFDHCRAIEAILNYGKPSETYNIGGGGEITNLALLHSLCDWVDELFIKIPEYKVKYPHAPPAQNRSARMLLKHVTDRLGHDRRYAINSTKIQQELNFKYSISIQKGLRQTVEWYLENPQWWAKFAPALESVPAFEKQSVLLEQN